MSALADVVSKHRHFVRASLARFGVATQALDDAEQEVFLVLVRRSADFDPRRSTSHRRWLWGISKNVAAAQRRRERRERARSSAAEPPAQRPPIEDRVAAVQLLGALDDTLRRVWIARHNGETAAEIAAAQHQPLTTIQWRLRAARKRVYAILQTARWRCGALLPWFPRASLRTTATCGGAGALILIGAVGAMPPTSGVEPTAHSKVEAASGIASARTRRPEASIVPPPTRRRPGPVPHGVVAEKEPVVVARPDQAAPAKRAAGRRHPPKPAQSPAGWRSGRVQLEEPVVVEVGAANGLATTGRARSLIESCSRREKSC